LAPLAERRLALTTVDAANVNLWSSPAHALEYLARADAVPHRTEGEGVLLECLPRPLMRVLDLGSGDGRLLALVKLAYPEAQAVAIDFSATMIDRLRARFASDPSVSVIVHDMDNPLPASLGAFDAIVSSFAIHHLAHERKRAIYIEVYDLLAPRGVFCNLEHVASPTEALHEQFVALGHGKDDPSNKRLDVETQLAWLRAIGFVDVDCHWKWRELALLAGTRSGFEPPATE
jgi:tRNA (cmo5U34)-methyltransferase